MTPGPAIDALKRILVLATAATGIDYRAYRTAVLSRRIDQRAAEVGARSLPEYVQRLERDPAEVLRLCEALLIHTTAPFRGQATFEALRGEVLPALTKRRAGGEVRAWVAACSTGEEAWSVALCLAEACEAAPGSVRWSILASDVHAASLTAAGFGGLSDEAAAKVPAELAERYLLPGRGLRLVRPDVRAAVHFVPHDMLAPGQPSPKAAVLASFDVVCCRNLLIYLEPPAQELVCERLVSACEPGGVVVLDESETLLTRGWHRVDGASGVWTKS